MATHNDQDAERESGRRMTLSRVVEALLERREHGASSVTLSRNAKGETQIEVVVRTSESGAVKTIEQAEAAARATYDSLRRAYPLASGMTGGAGGTGGSGGASAEEAGS